MIEWNNSNLWVKLSRICYAKILTQALPNLIHESIIWQFVKNFVSIVTFALCITHTWWTLADARVKRDKHLENRKCHFGSMEHFLFYKSSSFFTRRFLYIFGCCGPWCAGWILLAPSSRLPSRFWRNQCEFRNKQFFMWKLLLSFLKAPHDLPVKKSIHMKNIKVSSPVPNRVKAEGQFVKPNKWPGKVMFVRLRLVYKRRKCGLSAHVGREFSTHLAYFFLAQYIKVSNRKNKVLFFQFGLFYVL